MKTIHKFFLLSALACLFPMLSSGFANAQNPSIFFTDITSGPATGGETVSGYSGAYVTIYGNYFGSSQGSSSVTWNGQSCLRVVSWGQSWLWYQKIVVQLGSSCTTGTGKFAVTVNGASSSTAAVNNFDSGTLTPSEFTVRSGGHIYCVSNGGNDGNPGTFAGGCWGTIPKAGHTMAAGDITYIENGVSESSQDPFAPYNAVFSITSQGSAGNPIALVAYPNATVTMNTSQNYCIRTPAVSGPGPYWTIAGIHCTVTSNGEGFKFLQNNFRVVANTLSCPNSYGTAACYEAEGDGTNVSQLIYGNSWDNVGTQVNGQKTYHALYFSTGDDHSDIGWNQIANVHGCRGFQIYDSTGRDTTDIHFHDNVLHDIVCDGINLNAVRADTGTVEVYNNVLYNVGTGPDPSDGSAIYTCVETNANTAHNNPVLVYNNTCYNSGSSSTANSSQSGAFGVYINTKFVNNLVYQTSSSNHPYLTGDTSTSLISAGSANNDFYGGGSAPAGGGLTGSLNANPLIVSASALDFHLNPGSPLVDAGTTISGLLTDHDGVRRPQGSGTDIGAYERYSGSVAKPTCDLNGDGVVNVQDVALAVSQSLGQTACRNADLNQDTACNVVDVQRVINASIGLACRVGP